MAELSITENKLTFYLLISYPKTKQSNRNSTCHFVWVWHLVPWVKRKPKFTLSGKWVLSLFGPITTKQLIYNCNKMNNVEL